MRLTKQTGHAIRILIDCAQAGDKLVKAASMSERLGVTKQNVFKIVHILSHAGLLAPVRGPSGGVKLALPARDIRIGDVVRAVEVTHLKIDDGLEKRAGDRAAAPINILLDDALAAFISVLDQQTLADLAGASPSSAQTSGSKTRTRSKKDPRDAARKSQRTR